MKDASRKDRIVTAGIFEKRDKKLFIIVEPHSWLLLASSGLFFVSLRPGSKGNIEPELDPKAEKREFG